jgi:hypothetical protein
MFEEVLGIPAHPLLVHAAVVFVPLQALTAVVYAFVPSWRARMGWAALSLAVVGPVAAWFAKLSGEAFRDRQVSNGASGPFLDRIDEHSGFGSTTAWVTIALGVLTILLFLRGRAGDGAQETTGAQTTTAGVVIGWVLRLAIAAAAAAALYYIFRTGDTGAHLVWEGQ